MEMQVGGYDRDIRQRATGITYLLIEVEFEAHGRSIG
jgi:hypothetical protein